MLTTFSSPSFASWPASAPRPSRQTAPDFPQANAIAPARDEITVPDLEGHGPESVRCGGARRPFHNSGVTTEADVVRALGPPQSRTTLMDGPQSIARSTTTSEAKQGNGAPYALRRTRRPADWPATPYCPPSAGISKWPHSRGRPSGGDDKVRAAAGRRKDARRYATRPCGRFSTRGVQLAPIDSARPARHRSHQDPITIVGRDVHPEISDRRGSRQNWYCWVMFRDRVVRVRRWLEFQFAAPASAA